MTAAEVTAPPLARPLWRRARFWVALAVVTLVGAALVGTVTNAPGRPLDPASAHKNGSKAIVRLLEHYGTTVHPTSSVESAVAAGPGASVVITAPDAYSAGQLRRLVAAAGRVVLAAPGTRAGHAVASGLEPSAAGADAEPNCADVGAVAAGPVSFPAATRTYLPGSSGATACYGGAVLIGARLAVLGSADLLRNDHLADAGVAALDVNALTDSGRVTSVVWLQPGSDSAGPGPASIWDLFPAATHRAFWWIIALGALIVLWRVRRLGPAVAEPLAVIVRAAEIVEGQGRLYARAGARDRAAAGLRTATTARLGARLGLPRGATAAQVSAAAGVQLRRPSTEVTAVLAGPVPLDDVGLLRLAHDLDELESAVSGGPAGGTTPR